MEIENPVIEFILNQQRVAMSAHPGTVTLDLIRRHFTLTGTKEGCREGDCGACTVLLGHLEGDGLVYKAVNSCLLPIGDVAGKHLLTIEGINLPTLNPVQQAFLQAGAVQCGFCTPGFIISLMGYLLNHSVFDVDEAIQAVAGNICRCTGYIGIRRAIQQLQQLLTMQQFSGQRIPALVRLGFLPDYFLQIPQQLRRLDHRPSHKVENLPHDHVWIAGGTDLYAQKPQQLTEEKIVLLSDREEWQHIDVKEDGLYLGAGVTIEMMRRSPLLHHHLPGVAQYLQLVSSTQIRHRATVAGNVVNASPIGDLTIMLLALEATIGLTDGEHDRELPLRRFFLGYKYLDRRPNEWVKYFRLPLLLQGSKFHFEKVSKRTFMDIASVNTAIKILFNDDHIEEVHISAGGVAPIPLYLENTCAFLRGIVLNSDSVKKAVEIADTEISPISDVRGSAAYKRRLLRQLILAHFLTLFPGRFEEGF